MNGRRIYHARGKVLGGSSSINGMIFQRGNPLDYERWAADPGLAEWSYAHCLPYFKKMETCLAGADEFRGGSGPLVLERGPATNPLFQAFFGAVQEAGYELTERRQRLPPGGLRRLRPQHPARPPAQRRGRVPAPGDEPAQPRREDARVHDPDHLRRHACDRSRVHDPAAVTRNGSLGGEIICCGGAFNSPQLLQLSGVGNAAELRAVGVDVVHDLPGVGEHMQDHLEVYIQHKSTQPVSMAPMIAKWRRPLIGLQWLMRRGPGITNHFEAGGFARSNDSRRVPQRHVPLPADRDPIRRLDAAGRARARLPGARRADVLELPGIAEDHVDRSQRSSPRCGSTTCRRPRTRSSGSRRCTRARNILSPARVRPFSGGEISPGSTVPPTPRSSQWVRRDAETALHPSCTCRMGVEDDSVLDPDTMRVHGVDGLRVIDAASMRYVTNGNIYAPIMMLAEKSCDLVLGNTPLAPEPVDFFRRDLTP